MKFIKFTDRLGNHLFQFAAIYSLSDEVTIVCEDLRTYELTKEYSKVFFKDVQIRRMIDQKTVQYFEPRLNHDTLAIEDEICYCGYFQSYKYINRDKILSKYKTPTEIKAKIYKRYGPEVQNFVCMHVRRGDYLEHARKHPPCSINYYNSAMAHFEGRKILIISDDIVWCKKNFKGNDIIFSDNSSLLEDFFIQTMCHSNIISNSSFSWWGAYLNCTPNKRVIAPKKWFGVGVEYSIDDLIPPKWLTIAYKYNITEAINLFFIRIKSKLTK